MATAQEIQAAKYRVQIKRQLRKQGVSFNNEDPTEVLEQLLKLADAPKLSATETLTRMAEIYNPIKEQMTKKYINMSLDKVTEFCEAHNCKHYDIVEILSKEIAISLWKKAGLC